MSIRGRRGIAQGIVALAAIGVVGGMVTASEGVRKPSDVLNLACFVTVVLSSLTLRRPGP